VRNNLTWLEEFKETDWFSKILLILPYLLGIAVIVRFVLEVAYGPL